MIRAPGRSLLLIVALAWAIRLVLACRGGVMFYPDEWRYFTGIKGMNFLVQGNLRDCAHTLLAAGGHSGFAFASIPALLAQGLLRVTMGLHPEDTLWVATLWFTFLSALIPAAVHALARRRGFSRREALLAALLVAVCVSMARYSRHLFPYDSSMLMLLAGWWLAEDPAGRKRCLFPGGVLIGTGVWIYNGYWSLALTASLFAAWRILRLSLPAGRRIRDITLIAAGAVLPVMSIFLVSRLTDAGVAEKLAYHSKSLVGGSPSEGWWVPWVYFWHSEGLLFPFLLAGMVLAWQRRSAPGRWAATAVLVLYALLVATSNGLGLWPVFGRLARPLLPLLCMAAACGWAGLPGLKPSRALLPGAAAGLLALWNLSVPYREQFPSDILPRLLREHPGEVRVFPQNIGQRLPYAEPYLLDPAARYVFTNHAIPKCVEGHLPPPPGRVLWSRPHSCQLPYNHYNGYLAHERKWLRTEDFSMKWIDTRPETAPE